MVWGMVGSFGGSVVCCMLQVLERGGQCNALYCPARPERSCRVVGECAGADVDGATVLGSTALTGNCLPFGSPGAVGNTHRTAVVARAPHLSFAVPPEVSRWQKGGW